MSQRTFDRTTFAFFALSAGLLGVAFTAWPTLALAAEPRDLGAAVSRLVDAARAGKALAIAASAIWLLCTLLKTPLAGSVLAKLPTRWRALVPLALGLVAGLLDARLGGLGWLTAASGAIAIGWHELVEVLTGRRAKTAAAGATTG